MSARIRKSVLRIPCERVGIKDPWAFAEEHEDLFRWDGPCPRFQVAPTKRGFFDLVLRERVAPDCESYGRTRGLTGAEHRKYSPYFVALFPDCPMERVRLVDFCWYDGAEAPDYYEGCREDAD